MIMEKTFEIIYRLTTIELVEVFLSSVGVQLKIFATLAVFRSKLLKITSLYNSGDSSPAAKSHIQILIA